MKPYWLFLTLGLTACGSTTVFTPRSAYPPDPWVKGYSDPDDCIGGEDLAAVKFEMPSYPKSCLLYTSPSPRDATLSRMPSSA